MRYTLPALLIALGIASTGFFINHGITHFHDFDRYVSVRGLDEQITKSDQAIWNIQYTVSNNDLNQLYAHIDQTQKALFSFLKTQGFDTHNIQVNPVSVIDNESNSYNTNTKAKRYNANAGITLSTNLVDQVQKAAQKTGDLVKKGVVVTNSSVRYLFTQLNDIKPAMLNRATVNAHEAAQTFADNAKSQVGSIRHASQGLFTIKSANNSYDSDADIMKKVRVVVSIDYFIK